MKEEDKNYSTYTRYLVSRCLIKGEGIAELEVSHMGKDPKDKH